MPRLWPWHREPLWGRGAGDAGYLLQGKGAGGLAPISQTSHCSSAPLLMEVHCGQVRIRDSKKGRGNGERGGQKGSLLRGPKAWDPGGPVPVRSAHLLGPDWDSAGLAGMADVESVPAGNLTGVGAVGTGRRERTQAHTAGGGAPVGGWEEGYATNETRCVWRAC